MSKGKALITVTLMFIGIAILYHLITGMPVRVQMIAYPTSSILYPATSFAVSIDFIGDSNIAEWEIKAINPQLEIIGLDKEKKEIIFFFLSSISSGEHTAR